MAPYPDNWKGPPPPRAMPLQQPEDLTGTAILERDRANFAAHSIPGHMFARGAISAELYKPLLLRHLKYRNGFLPQNKRITDAELEALTNDIS